jgi:5,10-methenyltetrahydrofolate synthetase
MSALYSASSVSSSIFSAKRSLRSSILSQVRSFVVSVSPCSLTLLSQSAAQRLIDFTRSLSINSSDSICFASFLNFSHEIHTDFLNDYVLKLPRPLFVPRVLSPNSMNLEQIHSVDKSEIAEQPPYGIREPVVNDKNRSELLEELVKNPTLHCFLVMPGVAFSSSNGSRLGYGRGYYDQYIKQLKNKGVFSQVHLIGMAFDCQTVDYVPEDENDQRVDAICTPSRLLVFEQTKERRKFSNCSNEII